VKNSKAVKHLSVVLMAMMLMLNISGGAFAVASASSVFGSIIVQTENPYAQVFDPSAFTLLNSMGIDSKLPCTQSSPGVFTFANVPNGGPYTVQVKKQVDTAADGTKQYLTVGKNSNIHVAGIPTTVKMSIGAVMSIKVTYDKSIPANTPVQITTDDRSVTYTSNAKDILYVAYHNTPLTVGSAICPKLDSAGWAQAGWASAQLDPKKSNTFHVVQLYPRSQIRPPKTYGFEVNGKK
jgi:hypothetical protein